MSVYKKMNFLKTSRLLFSVRDKGYFLPTDMLLFCLHTVYVYPQMFMGTLYYDNVKS